MNTLVRSPWFTLSCAILGLVVGYTVVIARSDAHLASSICPVEIACEGENCPHA